MNIIEEKKLGRAFIMSAIEKDKLTDAGNYFNNYYKDIKSLKIDRALEPERERELRDAMHIFTSKLADKFMLYCSKEDWNNAITAFEVIKSFNKNILNNTDILRKYLKCLAKTKQNDLVNIVVNQLVRLADNKDDYRYYAENYHIIEDNKNSVKYMEEYINSKSPDEISADDYNWCGVYYNKLFFDNFDKPEYASKAIEYFKLAHEKNPNAKVFLHNITIVAKYINDDDLIMDCWEKIWKLGNLSHIQKFDYSLQKIKVGDLKEGYKYYSEEFLLEDPTRKVYFPKMKKPMWNGEDISDKTLLVHYHQGFGDTIMMARFIEKLKEYAKNVIFVVQRDLYPLMKTSFPDVDVKTDGLINVQTYPHDLYIAAMEIPVALGAERDLIEATNKKYLRPREDKIEYFKNKFFNNDDFKIGLAIKGKNGFDHFLQRSIDIRNFKVFNKIENAKFYILNKEISDSQIKLLQNDNYINLAKKFNDFEDTAAAMENCDLIISVDNCILNLAGALGKKTFGLYNYYNEWRWFDLSGDDVVWYSSVKPFINERMNDWVPTLEIVAQEVMKLQKNK